MGRGADEKLLSIGEVARIKGVGVRALRYYERVGVLRPAHVDPQTGYRSYAVNQLVQIDVILAFVQLGIPLRELRDSLSGGAVDVDGLLERGRELALEQLRAAQVMLLRIDAYRDGRAQQDETPRSLPTRRFLTAPLGGGPFDARRYARAITELVEQAQSRGLIALYTMGLLRLGKDRPAGRVTAPAARPTDTARETDACIHPGAHPSWHVALEVAAQPEGHSDDPEAPDSGTPGPKARSENEIGLATLPAGIYRVERFVSSGYAAAFSQAIERAGILEADAAFATPKGIAFISDVWDAQLRPDTFAVELITPAP